MRRWIWITPLSLVLLILAAAVLAPFWARSQVRGQAKARGLDVEIDKLSIGFFSAELTNLQLRLEGVEGLKARLDKVHVELSLSAPRLRSVLVEGGEIEIEGDVDNVRSQLSEWRARRPKKETEKQAPGPRRFESVRNLNLIWRGALEEGDTQLLKGVHLERGTGGQRFGIDLIQVSLGALTGEIAGTQLNIPGNSLDLTHAKLGATEVRLTVTLPSEAEEPPKSQGKPTTSRPPRTQKGTSPDGLEQRLEKNNARVAQVLSGLTLLRDDLLPKLPPHTKADRFWLTLLRSGERLHVGPSVLEMKKSGETFHASVTPKGDAEGTPLSFEFTLHPKQEDHALSFNLEGGPVSLSTLGIQEGAFGLQGVGHTRLAGSASAHLSQDAKQISGQGRVTLSELTLDSPRLSERLVSFPRLKLAAQGMAAIDGTHYKFDDLELSLGEARFQGAFEMKRGDDFVSLKANAKAPLVSCQALLDSAPRGLLGAVEKVHFDGTFSLDAGVKADTRELSKMRVHWDFKNGCRARKVPVELDPARFRGVFRREVLGAGNYPMELEFGPLSESWTPYAEISPFVEKALLVTEDGRFFRHDGFDDRAIESAIRDNARAGRFVRGASTISMQLAKNLYLSRDKTLARKFREAALTSLLEQSFDKKEILELYVNVIEFGPGIYGIGRAAEYYFSSTPQELTAAQAFFLASILPLPSIDYFGPDGTLSKARTDTIHRLLKISRKRDALTDEQLETALSEVLRFGKKASLPEVTAEVTSTGDSAAVFGQTNVPPEVDPSHLDEERNDRRAPKRGEPPHRGTGP